MKDEELKQALMDSGIQVKKLAALDNTKPQNLYKGVKAGTYFTIERLTLLYEYLRSDASSNLDALRIVARELEERLPRLRDSDRHLAELSPSPWRRAQLVLPHPDWLGPMLQAMGHDRRPCAYQRTLEVITSQPDPRQIQRACTEHLPLRYLLKVIRADVPALLPPTLILDDALALTLTLGDKELRPLAAEVGRRQVQALAQQLLRAEVPIEIPMTGGSRGDREPSAGDGQRHRVRFDTPADDRFDTPAGDRFELELEALGEDQWRMEFRALTPYAGSQRLRVVDQAGHCWLESRAGYLPWQGRRAFVAQNPAQLLDGLTLELQEVEDDHMD